MEIDERLKRQLEFIVEADKMKNIYRQTYVIHEDRKENDAEHSFHISLMVPLLAEYSNTEINQLKTMKMLLIHDFVEIDAGDTYCYGDTTDEDKRAREEKAADRLFNILPADMAEEYRALWNEFEAHLTPEAKFAASMDRLQPILLQVAKGGKSWKEHKVKYKQVAKRIAPVADGSEVLWNYLDKLLDASVKKGILEK